MIAFVPIDEIPEDAKGKAVEQADRTLWLWRVEYGDLFETQDHIDLAILGFVPTCYLSREGYFWMVPLVESAPRAALREGKEAFSALEHLCGWNTYIYTEIAKPRNRRFAEFLGYKQFADLRGLSFFRRA